MPELCQTERKGITVLERPRGNGTKALEMLFLSIHLSFQSWEMSCERGYNDERLRFKLLLSCLSFRLSVKQMNSIGVSLNFTRRGVSFHEEMLAICIVLGTLLEIIRANPRYPSPCPLKPCCNAWAADRCHTMTHPVRQLDDSNICVNSSTSSSIYLVDGGASCVLRWLASGLATLADGV